MRLFIQLTLVTLLGSLFAGMPAASAQAVNSASGFIRFEAGSEPWQGDLQTAIISYENDRGVTLDLVAAIHIGDRLYYEQLNAYFLTRDRVLYELVANPEDRPDPQADVGSGAGLSFLQRALAGFLGVSYQLQEVNYLAQNFVHADMSPSQLQEVMTAKNENFFTMFLSMALAQMASSSGEPSQAAGTLQILAALRADNRRDSLKYLLAEELARSDAISINPALESQLTLLGDRNQIALQRLSETLENPAVKSISIFYGAAHMAGMEREILQSMGFSKVGQSWLTAWSIP